MWMYVDLGEEEEEGEGERKRKRKRKGRLDGWSRSYEGGPNLPLSEGYGEGEGEVSVCWLV